MKKSRFYLSLSILNILLCLCVICLSSIFAMCAFGAENNFIIVAIGALLLLVKILLLPVLDVIVEKNFSNSILNEFFQELKINATSRRSLIILSILSDIIFIFYFCFRAEALLYWISFVLLYMIVYLGGVSLFYVSLLGFWKIQGKLK